MKSLTQVVTKTLAPRSTIETVAAVVAPVPYGLYRIAEGFLADETARKKPGGGKKGAEDQKVAA